MKNNKGFSLVELIIVIAIMAVLIGVLAPQYLKYVEKSRISSDETAISGVREAMVTSLSDEDVYGTISGDEVTVTIDGSNGTITSTNDKLASAVQVICKDMSAFGSKTYKGQSIVITANYSTAELSWTVESMKTITGKIHS